MVNISPDILNAFDASVKGEVISSIHHIKSIILWEDLGMLVSSALREHIRIITYLRDTFAPNVFGRLRLEAEHVPCLVTTLTGPC